MPFITVFSLHRMDGALYVFLLDDVFLPCDHGLDFDWLNSHI